MNSKAKRLLSWLCVLALCMSLLPMTALAAPGSGSSLEPADKYYALNGEEASSDADITLSKTAVDNRDGTYTVTLSATADRVVTAKPTEVVFVIDGSGSMNWCEDKPNEGDTGYIGPGKKHYHGNDNTHDHPYCTLVENDQKESRWDIALDAIETMMENLGNEGISYKFVVYKGAQNHGKWYTYAETYNNFAEVQNISPLGGTPLVKGFSEAVEQFEDSNSNQVMIIVADGASDDNLYPNYGASQFKDKGGEIYTVGFTFSSDDFNDLSNGNGYHFTADNADQLKLSMEQISENIKGLISDPLGQNVELVGDVKVDVSGDQNAKGRCWVTNERTINWTCAEGLNGTVTLTYTVKVKDDAIQVGSNTIPLNGKATLNYSTTRNGYHEVLFPKPAATFDAATLSVDYQFDGETIREDNEWVAVTDDAAFDTKIPAVGEQVNVNGTNYWVTDVRGSIDDPLEAKAYEVQVILSKEQPALSDSIDIEVYLDGSKVEATNAQTFGQYITDVTAVGTTQGGQVSYDATNHRIQLSYQYDTINAADVRFTVTNNYVLQGIEGTFVRGENSWRGITPYGSTWTADNVQGKSTLKVYLNTEYTVKYYVNGAVSPDITDETVYITTEGVGTANTPNFDGVTDGNVGQKGSWKNEDLKTSITVQGLPENTAEAVYSGWWLNDSPYEGEPTFSGGNSVSVTDAIPKDDTQVIKFYAQSSIPTANYTVNYVFLDKDGNKIADTDSWTSGENFPKSGTANIGDKVDQGNLTPTLPNTVQPAGTSDNYFLESCTECTITAETDKNVITVTYALDNWDGKDNEETGGDGTPDYQQALIKYVVAEDQDGYGSVSPVTQVETFTETNGAYTGEVTASSTATASNDYAFDYWTKDSDDSWKDWDTELSDTFTAEGGKTYTYTANFAEDKNGDGTPDKYQVFVNFASKDDNQGTVSTKDGATDNTGIKQVYTLKDDAGNYVTNGNVTPSLDGVEVTAEEDFVFTNSWTKDDEGTQVDPTDTLENVNGGTTITFYAHFTGKNPNLTVKKSVQIGGKEYDGSVVSVGTELTYTITVTNTGNTTFDSVTVKDSMWGDGKIETISIEGVDYNCSVDGGYWNAVTPDGPWGSVDRLNPNESWTCTYTYTVTEDDVEKGSITNVATATGGENTTGKDEQIVWTNGVVVTPADITLYTGGKGYSGIVGNADTGEIVEDHESTGLPEPGYYIQLPDALNEALLEALDKDAGTVLDLSQYVEFTYDDNNGTTRTWSLELYDKDGNSKVSDGRYVYRLVSPEGQDPVRLQITGDTVEDVVLSDVFQINLNDDLYRKYDMAIYSGGLDIGQVKITFNQDNDLASLSGKSYSVNTASGELTIRGVTDGVETATVGTDTTTGFRAEVDGGTTYTINGSNIGVKDNADIHLLVDNIVTAGDGEDAAAVTKALQDKANEALNDETLTNPTYDMKYMDLVDNSNGNVYVTAKDSEGENADVTITWPVPADAAEDTDFYVVHFDDLDREFSGEDAVTQIENCEKVTVIPTVTSSDGQSITFTTSTFSPFVLVYEQAPATAPSLDVTKALTAVNSTTPGSSVSVGDTLTYTITVKNTGNVDLTNVTVTDTLSNGRTVTWANLPDGVTNTNGTLTIASLTAEASVELTATYKVQKSDANGTLTNAVTVNGTTPGGGENPTDEDTEETPVDPYYPPAPPVDPPELNTEDHYAYIVGYPDGTVRPEGNITRAEVATIFFRLLTDESRDEFWSQTNPYSDVSADDWYNNAVSTLTNAGILDGYEDGTFRPNGNITRAEFATITARFFDATYEGEDLFPDIDGHWAQKYINESANAGIVNGYEDGTFRPQKLITRAEAMTMVNRTIDRHPDAEHLLDDMIVWPDNLETAWYYEQVQEATNSHTYTMHTDAEKNPYEIWSELLPVRDWAQLEKEWSDAHSGQTGGEVV